MTRIMTSPVENAISTRYTLLSCLEDWDDQDRWRDFFDTYCRFIYSVALKSGLTEAEAEDAVQETIVSVAKDIHKFKRDRSMGSFKGWLRNLTRWRIRQRYQSADELMMALLSFKFSHYHQRLEHTRDRFIRTFSVVAPYIIFLILALMFWHLILLLRHPDH